MSHAVTGILSEETITLYEGERRQVRTNGRTDYQIVGELRVALPSTKKMTSKPTPSR